MIKLRKCKGGVYPHSKIFPKVLFLVVCHHAENKMGNGRDKRSNISPQVSVCAFNPFGHPLIGVETVLARNNLLSQGFRISANCQSHLANRALAVESRFIYGYDVPQTSIDISHLLFVDDTLPFSTNNEEKIENLIILVSLF